MAIASQPSPTSTPSRARVQHARFGTFTLFASMGVLLATFLSRIPTMRDLLDVTPSGLAGLIIFGAAGALVALLITGWVVNKLGTRRVLWWSSLGYLVAFSLEAVATAMPSKPLFAVAHFFVSFSFAFTNVAMNAEAAVVERKMGRSVMPQFHAAFSVGVAGGLGIGALISHAGIAPVWHFIAMGALLTVVRLFATAWAVLDGRPVPVADGAGLGGPFAAAKAEYRDRHVLLIGVVVFAASMTEMIAAQWVSLSVVDDFGKPEAIGDLMYWIFVVAMVSARWWGSRILDALGRVVTLRVSAILVILGVSLYVLTPSFVGVPIALALWGLGAALGTPIAFSAAADDPGRAAARVAAVSSFATVAGLIVPQLVGHLAEAVTLRNSLLVVCAAAVTTFVLARAIRSDGKLFKSRRLQERQVGANRLLT